MQVKHIKAVPGLRNGKLPVLLSHTRPWERSTLGHTKPGRLRWLSGEHEVQLTGHWWMWRLAFRCFAFAHILLVHLMYYRYIKFMLSFLSTQTISPLLLKFRQRLLVVFHYVSWLDSGSPFESFGIITEYYKYVTPRPQQMVIISYGTYHTLNNCHGVMVT